MTKGTLGPDTLSAFVENLKQNIPYEGCGIVQPSGTFREFSEEEARVLGVQSAPASAKDVPLGPVRPYGRPNSNLSVIYRRP